jgi:uncharacterized protein (DUF2147 family)
MENIMTKVTRILGAAIISLACANSVSASPASILGNWVTKDGDAVIKIAPCGANICGTVAKFLKTPPKGADQRDDNNPDPAKRTRKLLGSAVLINFKPVGNEYKGSIYDARNGKTYRSVVYKGKSGNLVVKGCIGPFCQSQTWTASK